MGSFRLEAILVGNVVHGVGLTIGSHVWVWTTHNQCADIFTEALQLCLFHSLDAIAGVISAENTTIDSLIALHHIEQVSHFPNFTRLTWSCIPRVPGCRSRTAALERPDLPPGQPGQRPEQQRTLRRISFLNHGRFVFLTSSDGLMSCYLTTVSYGTLVSFVVDRWIFIFTQTLSTRSSRTQSHPSKNRRWYNK